MGMQPATASTRRNDAHDAFLSERMLCEEDAAEFLGFSKRALQNWRLRGGGPPFVKVSARAVRYRFCDLRTWATARLRKSTSHDQVGE